MKIDGAEFKSILGIFISRWKVYQGYTTFMCDAQKRFIVYYNKKIITIVSF